ncbi:MFS transporter [Massilia sp. METH4]|uniref:MFS transporter n=1 Tax=Massilia sp. METH4 TaxID=3123041 RepID=UPI0030D0FF93
MYGIAKTFGPLYLATLMMQVGATLLITFLALRASGAGADDFQVGALMAAHALGMVGGAGVGRLLIARLGHVRAYVASAGIILLAVLGHAASAALPLWLVLRVIVGVATICQWMVLESWLNDRADSRQRGTVLAIYMIATYGGMMLGQLAVGLDDAAGTYAYPAVALAFVLALVPLAITRAQPPSATASQRVPLGSLVRGLAQPLGTVFVSGTLNGSFFGLAALYAAHQGMDAAAVGRYLAFTVVAGLLAQLPLGWLSDRVCRVTLIRGIAVALALACLPLGLYQGFSPTTLLVFAFAIGSLQFCMYPLGAGLANERIAPHLRVPLAGLLLTVFGVGSCLGPLLAGALMSLAGAPSLYCFLAACAAGLAVFMGQARVVGAQPDRA